jgi:hypothetical protein
MRDFVAKYFTNSRLHHLGNALKDYFVRPVLRSCFILFFCFFCLAVVLCPYLVVRVVCWPVLPFTLSRAIDACV